MKKTTNDNGMTYYEFDVEQEISLPEEANCRYEDLNMREIDSAHECRVIGGDKGDLHFFGFIVADGKTVLDSPVLFSGYNDLTDEEAFNIAEEILWASYESIGIETVEH